MKYDKAMVTKIVELYATGKYTIVQICNAVGIVEDTFYRWRREETEFSESLKKADEERLVNIKEMAMSGLAKLVSGYEYIEVSKEKERRGQGDDAKLVPTAIKRTKKFQAPNPAAVIFALCNLNPDNFKQKNHVDHTTDGEKINEVRFTVRRNQETQPDGN